MRCIPKKTIKTVIESNNDVLVQLKRNQPCLHDAMVEHAQKQTFDDTHRMHDPGKRNRIERRGASIWHLPQSTDTEFWHGHFKTLICIQRLVGRFDTRQQDWQSSEETAYYLCARHMKAEEANKVIRNHTV